MLPSYVGLRASSIPSIVLSTAHNLIQRPQQEKLKESFLHIPPQPYPTQDFFK